MSMLLDEKQCYQATKARDARFDGRFFFGVSSTGVYCRPVCSAKPPRFENCFFFPSAATAEAAGFRPCLRCRPELAPGNASIDAIPRLTQKAISLIEDGFLNESNLSALAKKLNISNRHLHRVFQGQLGVNPIKFAQTQRLLLAKRLLADTLLPVTEIAFAAGFNSLRRFNILFKTRYGVTPTNFRQTVNFPQTDHPLVFELRYCLPFNWSLLLGFIKEHVIPGVEQVEVENGRYRRTVRLFLNEQWHTGWLAVEDISDLSFLRVSLDIGLIKGIVPILKRIKGLFDLSCHPDKIEPILGTLAQQYPGLRVPGAFDGFEVAIMAILEQSTGIGNLSVLAKKFVSCFGEAHLTPFTELTHVFPTSDRIAFASVDEIKSLGINVPLAKTIIILAQAIRDKKLIFDSDVGIEESLKYLFTLPEIHEKTRQYILMRALSWPDALPFSSNDVTKVLNVQSSAAHKIVQTWSPWRSYATMHLWAARQGEKS